ncbi:immunoglobulin kappa light chain-like isoform X1 [Xyrichtys novacula]|nr:immunoglobulin kappa light chain-like isoform X1 [Xyrichtys novacula]
MSVFLCGKALTSDRRLTSSVRQESSFISANVGDNVTLQCFYEGNVGAMLFWYKQAPGQEPRLICSFYRYDRKGTFSEEFEDNTRFVLETQDSKNHLIISDLLPSDSATYFCVSSYAYEFQFAEGTTVSVKGSAVVQHSESETNQPGGSVTLNCTVQTGNCDGEHSVYWFKNSDESQPGLLYTNEGRNEQCEREPDSQTHTCEYSLPVKNLNVSDAGTYYCAVVSCGHILFGNGIKLDFKGGVDYPALVYFLSGALIFAAILIVFMAVCMYKMNKRNSFLSQEAQAIFSAASSRNLEDHREAENLFYAALSVNMSKTSRRQRNMVKEECVYSSVKQ